MRRRHRVVGLALLALLAGLGVERWRSSSSPAAAAREVGVLPTAGAASTPRATPVAPASSVAGAAPSASASGIAVAGPFDRIPPEGLQVCGGGRVTADEVRRWQSDPVAGQTWLDQQEASLMQRASVSMTRLAGRLAAGGAPQQVAARLLMGDLDGAAAIAAPSTDPLAYQMALTACGGHRGRDAPACSRLSAQHWAALDPTNARPWLRMLDEAQLRDDAAAVDAALAEVAARPRLSPGTFLLEAQLVAVADLEPDPALLTRVLATAIGTDLAMPWVDVSAVTRACFKDPAAAARRLPLCRQAAQQLLAASSDLLEASIARKLAERTGVPKSAQAHDEATLRAAQLALAEDAAEQTGLDCASLKRMTQASKRRAAVGELGLALELLKERSPPAPGR
jgi:hypothetical protein